MRSSAKVQDEEVHVPMLTGLFCQIHMAQHIFKWSTAPCLRVCKAQVSPSLPRTGESLQAPLRAKCFLHQCHKDLTEHPNHSCPKHHPGSLMLKKIKGKFLWINHQHLAGICSTHMKYKQFGDITSCSYK